MLWEYLPQTVWDVRPSVGQSVVCFEDMRQTAVCGGQRDVRIGLLL